MRYRLGQWQPESLSVGLVLLGVQVADTDRLTMRQSSNVPPEADVLFRILMPMLTLLVTLLLDKTTRKTSGNSSIPASQMEEDDDTAQRAKPGRRSALAND